MTAPLAARRGRDALAKARAEAEQFARTQNMRVARLLRFSEAGDDGEALRYMMERMTGGAGTIGAAPQVETTLSVEVAFALAPQ